MTSPSASKCLALLSLLVVGQTCSPVSLLEPGNAVDEDVAVSAQRRVDRDLDGFVDGIDPAPGNPDWPADVGDPEAIMANPLVVQALADARARGLIIDPTAEPPTFNIAGRYAWERDMASFLLTSDATDEGESVAPGEFSLTWIAPGLYRLSEGHQTEEQSLENRGLIHLRGDPGHFTLYAADRSECGTGRPRYSVSIRDAALDARTGDLIGYVALNVMVAAGGGPVCDIPGGDEPGGWQVVLIDRVSRK